MHIELKSEYDKLILTDEHLNVDGLVEIYIIDKDGDMVQKESVLINIDELMAAAQAFKYSHDQRELNGM